MKSREREVSTRLIRPSQPDLDIDRLLLFVERWNPDWELDASIKIYDEGIAQYLLVDAESHYKYFAALILAKPSLRCALVEDEPEDVLDNRGNVFRWTLSSRLSGQDQNRLENLRAILSKRGYRFE